MPIILLTAIGALGFTTMKYRDARLLKEGDVVHRKDDNALLIVESIEAFGQYRKVKVHCRLGEVKLVLYNEELK